MAPLVRTLASTLLGASLALGCTEGPAKPEGPAEVLMKFVFEMRQVHGEGSAGDEVVELLWEPARENLEERARRASALSGRELSPGEMLVPSWFAQHLAVERAEARIDGEWAEVTAYSGDGRSVQARLRREEGAWKVALELPPLAPIRVRDDAE